MCSSNFNGKVSSEDARRGQTGRSVEMGGLLGENDFLSRYWSIWKVPLKAFVKYCEGDSLPKD